MAVKLRSHAALETLKVTNKRPEKVKTSFATQMGAPYIIGASGVVSDWADKIPGLTGNIH